MVSSTSSASSFLAVAVNILPLCGEKLHCRSWIEDPVGPKMPLPVFLGKTALEESSNDMQESSHYSTTHLLRVLSLETPTGSDELLATESYVYPSSFDEPLPWVYNISILFPSHLLLPKYRSMESHRQQAARSIKGDSAGANGMSNLGLFFMLMVPCRTSRRALRKKKNIFHIISIGSHWRLVFHFCYPSFNDNNSSFEVLSWAAEQYHYTNSITGINRELRLPVLRR